MSTRRYTLVQGIDKDRNRFRPSDWADRFCCILSSYGDDRRIRYSPMLLPTYVEGVRSIRMDRRLEEVHPDIAQALMDFARTNNLTVTESIEEVA